MAMENRMPFLANFRETTCRARCPYRYDSKPFTYIFGCVFFFQKLTHLLWVDGFFYMGKHQSNDLLKLIQAIQGLWRLLVLGLGLSEGQSREKTIPQRKIDPENGVFFEENGLPSPYVAGSSWDSNSLGFPSSSKIEEEPGSFVDALLQLSLRWSRDDTILDIK